MAVRIAIANHRGGVGKSTTTMMLAEGLALCHNRRVLVLDFDPQAMSSKTMIGPEGIEIAARNGRSLSQLLGLIANGNPIQLSLLTTTKASDLVELRDAKDARRVDLIASDPVLLRELSEIEARISARNPQTRIDQVIAESLASELARLDRSYDVVLFDCPAGATAMTLAALRLSSVVLAPTVLEGNSLLALREFIRIILDEDLRIYHHLRLLAVVMTNYVAGNPEQRLLLDHILQGLYPSLNAIPRPVPHATAIQRAVMHPGRGNFRRAREKYDTAFAEVVALANAVVARII